MKKQPVDVSIQGCLELFLDRCERENLSPATIQFYEYNIDRFIRYLSDELNLENSYIKDFKVETLQYSLSAIHWFGKLENTLSNIEVWARMMNLFL